MKRYVALLFVTLLSSTFAVENQCSLVKSGRIIEGEDAPEGAYPFMASLRRAENQHFCGGSIISDRLILTAAHCLDGQHVDHVVVGTNTLNQGGDEYYAEKQIIHPEWDKNDVINDLRLVVLSSPIQFNELVEPVPLPTEDMDKHNYPATAIGWGRLEAEGPISNKLQHLRTCLIDKASCAAKVQTANIYQKICTFTEPGQGVCKGDSGGPLIVGGQQVGVVSYVLEDCALGLPDIFTRVISYLDWINEEKNKY